MSLLTLGPSWPSCPLQAILLSDLFGCDSPLQIVMAVWRAFFHELLRRADSTGPVSPTCFNL